MSTIIHEDIGPAKHASPSIWHRFPLMRMNELGLGYYFHEEFLAGPSETWATGEPRPKYGEFGLDCDDDTVTSFLADLGGVLDIETDADDNDAYALFNRPWCKTVLKSRIPWAFEVLFELGDITMDGGMFIGLMENAGLSLDAVADDAAALVGESLIGFQILTADPDAIAAVYQLDAGTTVILLADATNSAAITAGGGTISSLVNDTGVKVGMTFDGKDILAVFINGHKVLEHTIDSSLFPVGVDMGLIALSLKTGTTAAESANAAWARGAYQERS